MNAQPETVEQLLAEMVAIRTVNTAVSGDAQAEAPLTAYLEAFAQAQGWRTRRLPVPGRADNLLVTFEVTSGGGGGGPWLLFDNHLDTVTTEGMTIDPFAAAARDGKMFGRGVCDVKGAGAAMLWALKQYAQSPAVPPAGVHSNNIAILFSIDEEFGMAGVRSFVERDFPVLGFKPAGVIVSEPTMLQPVVAHNGVVRWRITVTGVAAHSADPSRGVSAISKMVKVIQALESRYLPSLGKRHALTGKAQCSVNLIQGGTQINIVPDHCHIDIDRRVVPGENPDEVLPAVAALLEELCARDKDLKVEQSLIFSCPPLSPARDESLLPAVQGALASRGLPGEPIGVGYATNAGEFSRAGVPAIVLGPGDIAQAHTRDEWLALEQLHKGVDVYRALMAAPMPPPR